VDGDEEDAAAELEELEKEMQHRYTEEEEEELEEEEEADKDDRRQHHHHYHHQHATTTTDALLQGHMSYGRTHEDVVLTAAATICPPSSFPLLTNHQVLWFLEELEHQLLFAHQQPNLFFPPQQTPYCIECCSSLAVCLLSFLTAVQTEFLHHNHPHQCSSSDEDFTCALMWRLRNFFTA
jgi:hypothetical protein